MINGEERRKGIMQCLRQSSVPVSGTELAKTFNVSRQVIVQDIALLRAQDQDILSTHKGYICHTPMFVSRVFYVCHGNERIEEELNLIVDCGGRVEDVFVQHDVYGQLRAELGIDSRKKAKEFIKDIVSGKSSPLNNITSGYHYHTVTADSDETLDEITRELKEHEFLVEVKEMIS